MSDSTLDLLKELTEINGIPGYEAPVREVVRKHLDPLGELSQDKIGSVICKAEGQAEDPKVMLAGHMDEIGFMVKHITKEGFLHFLPLGSWFDQVLLGQRVVIKTKNGDVVGVIGAKPPHLLPADQRNKIVKKQDMYIDIGATSKEEVEQAGVRPGDPAIPRADFVPLANGKTYLSKAFDDRVGVALLVSSLQELKNRDHPNTIYGVATVQEEVGLDVPGIKPEESSVKLGKGPTVLIYDARMIPNLKLRDFVMGTAEEIDVPIQHSYVEGGSTDGAAIHLHNTGVPTVVIGVAVRHIHSDSSILHRDDYDNAVKLLVEVIKRLDTDTVAEFTA
jgi:endoglucanase